MEGGRRNWKSVGNWESRELAPLALESSSVARLRIQSLLLPLNKEERTGLAAQCLPDFEYSNAFRGQADLKRL